MAYLDAYFIQLRDARRAETFARLPVRVTCPASWLFGVKQCRSKRPGDVRAEEGQSFALNH
jgi:hypothetical protein